MEVNQKKLERQLGIVDKWVRETGARGTLVAATGFGKTYTAILAIKRFRKKYLTEPIIVVVPSLDLKGQWETELKKNSIEHISVWVVNTYIKYRHQVELLILDETHRFFSDEFYKVFENTDYSLILGLSATIERLDGRHELLEEIAPIFETITLEEAKREGYVSDFTVYNCGLSFNEEDNLNYDKYDSTFKNNFAYFHRDFDLAMSFAKGDKTSVQTVDGNGVMVRKFVYELREEWARAQGWEGESYVEDAVDTKTNYYHPKTVKLKAIQWLQSMRLRKLMIYKASAKIEAIQKIIKKFPDRKAIVFSEDSEFADKVSEALGSQCRSYHTKIKTETREVRTEKFLKSGKVKVEYKTKKFGLKKLREEIIEDFKNNKFKILSVVRALDEGFDDEDVDLIIMASYTSSTRQNVQRTGRGIRKKEGKHAIVINLYMLDSQEETWLKSKQKEQNNITWVNDVDEIYDISTFSLT